jgi:hypothetical protein
MMVMMVMMMMMMTINIFFDDGIPFHIRCVYFVKLVRVPRIRFLSERLTATEDARKFPFP